jgi:tRNA threonylcarbamoyladenosine modification (KEOPS) complex  Pcc1 subunit
MKTANFFLDFKTEREAKIIMKSIDPEIKHKIPKVNVEINLSNKKIFLKIEADDLSSLRAACNSYLRWINTAVNIKKIV